ncbi:tail fibers protein [Escherichia phage vB_EcoP_PHB20]|uniref:Tail fibers protein n=1 Tax=Escherichia phage vB_EcoP_PHB20 TaxID=2698730 RepID=A0A6B9RHX8_9CAUD|nr:tail fibers protein [Escherichia phage vB_EcoP_PHB20]
MANVIKTVLTYQLDGSTRDFNIPFEYLARKFVVVTLIGVDRKVLTLNTDYRFATRTTISLTKAWGPSDGYTTIVLRRVTSTTDRLVDFTDGSILRAYDLNVAQIQTMHVAEEARDLTADTIGVNNDGHLDARGRKIVNLAYATGDYDAVPLKQVKERETSAWNAATKANEHADRSNREANRSRDEANRAQREADRSTQQADVSKQQAVESKKQADRSDAEADRAKGYVDSMIASVAEAEKQADRADSEANRARDEADRAAGEVTKAAAEVAKAAAHVETAKGHADRANTEANRSKGEADRAKSEADKLGNMNSLAGAIDRVEDLDVYFKRKVSGKDFTLRNDAKGADTKPVELVWTQWRGEGSKETVWEQWIQAGPKRMDYYTFINTDPATWPDGRSNSKGKHTFFGDVLLAGGNVEMHGNLKVNAVESKNTVSLTNEGASFRAKTQGGGWSQWTGSLSPDVQHDIAGQGDINYLLERATIWGKEHLYAKCLYNNGTGVNFFIRHYLRGTHFDYRSDGTLLSSTGWYIPPDGNLYIKKYNEYIDAWVNKRLDEHAYNKSTADGLYIRKNAGWSEVWKGRVGGGVSVSLSQDVRWRTIWIQTNDHWNPIEIGDDGAYFLSSMGGWITFTISNGGRTFKNDRDEKSVPTSILVRNN